MIKPFDDTYFMRKALDEAHIAFDKDEVPIGAVVVCDNQIIARAHNLCELLGDVTAHAEMQCFTSAASYLGGKYLDKCSLYVTVEPCPMCAGAAYWTRIGKVFFGSYDKKRGFSTLSENFFHPKTVVKGGILEEECTKLMQDFFSKKR